MSASNAAFIVGNLSFRPEKAACVMGVSFLPGHAFIRPNMQRQSGKKQRGRISFPAIRFKNWLFLSCQMGEVLLPGG